jgi:hypothetical protein
MDRLDHRVRCRRQEAIDQIRLGYRLRLGATVALELGQDASEDEQRTINQLDSALREPFGDTRGAREAAEVLKKLLALGLSKYEPYPLQAIGAAERRQAAR